MCCPMRSKRRSSNGCFSRTRAWREPGTRSENTGGCMSNTHGHLPKAERAQLPAELQQRLAAWTTKAYTDDNLFRSYWIPGSYAPSIVREAQLLFKAIEKEGLQGGKGDNNWVVRHRQIPRPWNPTRASIFCVCCFPTVCWSGSM